MPAARPRAYALLLAAAGLLPLVAPPRAARAAAPPDAEVDAAETEQDRALSEAQRAGSTARVAITYGSRFERQATALNRYLYARALFHNADPAGAQRELDAVVAAEPGFWQAQVRLAMLHLEAKKPTLARKHLDLARSARPEHVDVLKVTAQVGIATKDWDLAILALRRLQTVAPAREYQLPLLSALSEKGDWAGVYPEARALRLKGEKHPLVRAIFAKAAAETGRTDEAIAEYEALAKDDAARAGPALAELQQLYVKKNDAKGLLAVLERLRPFVKSDRKADLERAIEALKSGRPPGQPPEVVEREERPPTEEEYTEDLLARCLAPDVKVRRAALQEFFDMGPLGIPKAIQLRYHPSEEPDPECRAWVLKLVGALKDEGDVRRDQFAKIPGHALQDGDSLVRRVAAEVLGQIGTPCGVLYLAPNLGDLPLAPDAGEDVVKEYNAIRLAHVRITGHDDLPVGAAPWVDAVGGEASRKRWYEWFASPDGVAFLRRAVEDLVRTGESHPEWYLVYQIYVAKPEVGRAAYEALLARSRQPQKDATAQRLYPTFPEVRTQVDGKTLTPDESFADAAQRVKAWWAQWTAFRDGPAK